MLPDELKNTLQTAESEMDKSVSFLKKELKHIRTGKAHPSLLDGIKVEYYGTQTPLNQLANVSAPEARLLTVEPFDKNSIEDIEKAIMSSGLGLNPNNDGSIIRIPLPVLSEERRKELVDHAKKVAEDARISIRNARKEAKNEIEKKTKEDSLPEDAMYEAEEVLQNKTDEHTNKVDKLVDKKKDEIMTV
jgi:ribosome recycling factor